VLLLVPRSSSAAYGDDSVRRDLTDPLIEYATALRMREAPTPAQVDAADDSLVTCEPNSVPTPS
jgi:hypothetical protein